jgi:two-component system, NtrC family, response regulator AtoC
MIVDTTEMLNSHHVLFIGNSNKQALIDRINVSDQNFKFFTTVDEEKAINYIRDDHPKVVLIDYDRKNFQPLDFITKIKKYKSGHIIFGLTEEAPLDIIVKSIKMGVNDVIHIKDEPAKLEQELKKILQKNTDASLGESLYRKQKKIHDFDYILSTSPSLENIFALVSRIVFRKWVTILLLGETGSGKGMIARAIHYKSFNENRPFVEINCNALPENLLESELFGYEKGAFTDAKTQKKGLFEMAENGTLFLDEIGDISNNVQTKLLKAIENKSIRRVGGVKDIHINTRIIAATNRNMQEALQDGSFRTDLYYRLNVVSFVMPPLRERRYDTALLATKFLTEYAAEYESPVKGFSASALQMLKEYAWPGNIRELKHTIERLVLLSDCDFITIDQLQDALNSEINKMNSPRGSHASSIDIPPNGLSLEEGEKLLIQYILERIEWNKRKACNMLKISRPTLDRKIEKYNLLPTQNHNDGAS